MSFDRMWKKPLRSMHVLNLQLLTYRWIRAASQSQQRKSRSYCVDPIASMSMPTRLFAADDDMSLLAAVEDSFVGGVHESMLFIQLIGRTHAIVHLPIGDGTLSRGPERADIQKECCC